MLKKILLALVLVCFLGTFAFILIIHYKIEKCSEETTALNTMRIAKLRETLKHATTGEEKARPQHYIGDWYCAEKDYATARAEYAKILAMPDVDPCHKSIAHLRIGYCYGKEGKVAEAQEAYLKLCLEQASTEDIRYIKVAFNKLDPLKLGKERYMEVLDTLILGIKATPENDKFLSMLKKKQKKLK